MFAVKGIYDGNSVVVDEPVAAETEQSAYYKKLQELNGSINDDSFFEHSDLPLENNLVQASL